MVDARTSDGNERKITDTDTTKVNSPQKLLTNREIPDIIQGVIPPVNQTTAYGVATSGRVLHAVRVFLHKEVVTSGTRCSAGFLKDPPVVNWKDQGGTILVDRNTVVIPPRTTNQVQTDTGHSITPISIGIQNIEDPRRPNIY